MYKYTYASLVVKNPGTNVPQCLRVIGVAKSNIDRALV